MLLAAAAAAGVQSVGGPGWRGICSLAEAAEKTSSVAVKALVIGTGYGGAVAALRLAQRGIPVTMLEKGRLWDTPGPDGKRFCQLLKPDDRAMWYRTQTKAVVSSFLGFSTAQKIKSGPGALDVISYPGVDVYMGRGVGGGSLVNQGMAVTPLRETLAEIFPSELDVNEMFSVYYPRAKQMLGVNSIRDAYFESSKYYQYARVARKTAAKAGFETVLLPSTYDFSYMEQEEAGLVPKSALANEAAYGNNYGKGSLDKNYLADALATGLVSIQAMHSVTDISVDRDGRYIVHVERRDLTGGSVTRKIYQAEYLFLSAGSIGTSGLLVAARETGALPALNQHIGTEWTANGDIFCARANSPFDPVGTTQSTITTCAITGRDAGGKPMLSMTLCLPVPYIETWISLYVTMASSPLGAQFVYDRLSGQVTLNWSKEHAAPVVKSAKFIHDAINKKTKTTYRSDLFDSKGGSRQYADNATYHPLGGCPLGKATDAYGRVKGYPKLYISDASLIPGSLCANPLLTVTALAERNMEQIIQSDFA